MLLKISCIILIFNTYTLISDCTSLRSYNNTFVSDLIKSQYIELRSELAAMKSEQAVINSNRSMEQERLEKMLHEIKSDQVLIRSELALIRTELTLMKSDQKQQEKDLDKIEQIFYGRNCAEAAAKSNQSGIYDILIPSYSNSSFRVACDMETRGGNWTIILKRIDGSCNFTRTWDDYKHGFGNIDGDFILGLDKIHALTADGSQELLVLLEDFEGDKRYETYEEFAIDDEQGLYALKTLGKANGTAGDSLTYHYGQNFSTYDRDNDSNLSNCAKDRASAWWYNACHYSQLTGIYKDNTVGMGINWYAFRGWSYSLKRAIMMIRPRKSSG